MKKFRTCFVYTLTLLFLTSGFLFSDSNDKIPVTTKSETAKATFMQARDAGDKLNIQKALDLYTKAIQEDPDFALAYAERSGFQNTGKEVQSDIQKAVSLEQNVSEGERLYIDGLKYSLDRDIEKQQQSYEALVSKFPNDERAHTLLGVVYSNQGLDDKAVAEYQKAIQIEPQFSAPYNMLGYAYKNLGKFDDADKTFQKYISLIPNDPNPYDSYAELLLKQGKFDQAIQNYQKALTVDPQFNPSRTGIVAAYIYQGDYDKARSEINNLLTSATTNPDKETAHRLLAISYIYEGKLDQALAEFDKEYQIAVSENDYPDMANIKFRTANVQYENGKFQDAKNSLKESVTDFEKSPVSNEAKENYRNTISYNESVISVMNPDKTMAAARGGEDIKNNFLSHQFKAIKAIQDKDGNTSLEELKQSNQNDPYVFYLMGRSYQLKGDDQNAKTYFDKAINYNGLPTVNSALAFYNAKKHLEMK